MSYHMKTLKTERFDASAPGGTFTNSATAGTILSTGVGIFAPALIPAFAASAFGFDCSNRDSNVVEIDVTGASAPGTIYIYHSEGSIPPSGQPPGVNDVVMAEINYGTGAFRYKASWTMPCSRGTGALYVAISSGTASSTISIAQFRLVVRILRFTNKA